MRQADRNEAGPSGNAQQGSNVQQTSRPPPPPPKDDRLDRVLASFAGLSGKFDDVKTDIASMSERIDTHAKNVQSLTREAEKKQERNV